MRMKKYHVDFDKEGQAQAAPDQNLLEASLAAGIPLYHVCGGKGRCSTCRVLIHEGDEHLSPPEARELSLQRRMRLPNRVRLACQTRVTGGPVRLSRILKDESDIGLYIGPFAGSTDRRIGEERELVLLFLDIRNFTPFIERNLAFDVIHIIRKLFTVFEDCIMRQEGRIIETAGDGLYAAFGFDAGPEVAAPAAVEAARAMLHELDELNATYFREHFNHTVQIGIGIHLGRVIMGDIRIGNSDHVVIMGYPVNIAARLQDATKSLDNNFVISEELYSFAKDEEGHPRATANLKGVSERFPVRLLGTSYGTGLP